MPLFPNPQISIESIQEAINEQLAAFNIADPIPDLLSLFYTPAPQASTTTGYAGVGLVFKLQPGFAGNIYSSAWLIDFTEDDATGSNVLCPFGIVSAGQYTGIGFLDLNATGTIGNFPAQLIQGMLCRNASAEDPRLGNYMGIVDTTGNGIYISSISAGANSGSILEITGSNFIYTGVASYPTAEFNNINQMSLNLGIDTANALVITNAGGTIITVISPTGVLSVPTFNSQGGLFAVAGSYDIRELNGSSITENWTTANASAATSLTINWPKAYSTAAPPFVQVTLGSAGTLAGYVATTAGITVSFSAAYTGAVNVYAMGAS